MDDKTIFAIARLICLLRSKEAEEEDRLTVIEWLETQPQMKLTENKAKTTAQREAA